MSSRRNATSTSTRSHHHHVNVPRPSHRPPSTLHSFRGDLKAQDIFYEKLKKRSSSVQVLFPGEDSFEMERVDMWNHDSICTPCLILQPKSNTEVSACVQAYTDGVTECLKRNRKSQDKTTLAIPRLNVAGGRNSIHAMSNGAIVLDLGLMRRVTVTDLGTPADVDDSNDSGNTTNTDDVPPVVGSCTVQGGARIVDLDSALGHFGLMAIMGTSQRLGVVGCIFGGGYGYTSRKYGLACDNVLSAEIILPDGRLKRCSPTKHEDLFWSLCGGGGGMGVVVSVTLKCYPLRHAARLTFDLLQTTPISLDESRTILKRWGNWICGDADNDKMEKDRQLDTNDGAPKDVYSQLILPSSDSNHITFLATSIDTNVIPQSEGLLDGRKPVSFRPKKRRPFSFLSGNTDKRCPVSWDRVPGLLDLVGNKFGATGRLQENFEVLRYSDQLQAYNDCDYWAAGNVFLSTKFAENMTNRIVEVLVQATIGSKSPNNESRITVMSAGGEIANFDEDASAFGARKMKYVIFIEGKWNADNRRREEKDKERAKAWVNWVVNQLHRCDGIQSTAHPESNRDQVSKSGRTPPQKGYFNYKTDKGRRLKTIKRRRDPKNVISMCPRISYLSSRHNMGGNTNNNTGNDGDDDDNNNDDDGEDNSATLSERQLNSADDSITHSDRQLSVTDDSITRSERQLSSAATVQDGEIDPPECLTSSQRGETSIPVANSVTSSHDELDDEEKSSKSKESVDESIEDTICSDVRALLSIATDASDEDLKDWSLPPEALTKADSDSVMGSLQGSC